MSAVVELVDLNAERRALQALQQVWQCHRHWVVLTGAGCSTGSGIPDYRDLDRQWKRPPPVTLQDFMGSAATRQRYWARSMLGWPVMAGAQPNAGHQALAALEHAGRITALVTQNVDGLHAAAGSSKVVDLHGRLDSVRCMDCGALSTRAELQQRLGDHNGRWAQLGAAPAPDGDADLEGEDFSTFIVPACRQCGGVLKPDVVFYGEGVPRTRVHSVQTALAAADGLLVVGSSLSVYSGLRFVHEAAQQGKPIVAINRGHMRGAEYLQLQVQLDCMPTLQSLLQCSLSD